MYASSNARLLIRIARTNLDRIPLSGEPTERDEDVLESPSRTVGTEKLLSLLNDGQALIAENAKAMYLEPLISRYTGLLSGFDQSSMARPLPGRVYRSDSQGNPVGARRRSYAEHNYLESSAREATPKDPAYTYDGGKLQVYPGSDPDVDVFYIEYPARITTGDVPDSPWHVSGDDSLEVGDVLAGPLAMYLTAKTSRSIERIGVHDLYMNLFERLFRPYRRTWRLGRPDDYQRSRVDEKEVNTEV